MIGYFYLAESVAGVESVDLVKPGVVLFLHLPFPILMSYVAAFSEVIGSWLLITGLLTRFGALAVAGTISVAIYHAIVTAGFNIYLLELLGLYFAAAVAVLACGPGSLSIDELIARRLEPDYTVSSESLDELVVRTPGLSEAPVNR